MDRVMRSVGRSALPVLFGLLALVALGLVAISSPQARAAAPQLTPTAVPTPACDPAALVVDSPNQLGRSELFGVDGLSDGDVWAVGSYFTPTTGTTVPLIERWTGTAWSQVRNPDMPGTSVSGQFSGVDAVAADDVWAVGSTAVGSQYSHSLIAHWDGTRWSRVPSPDPQGLDLGVGLSGVSAISADDVWAVGSGRSITGTGTLTMHWDGSSWSVVPSPSPPQYPGTLLGVDGVATNDVWAVGHNAGQYPGPAILHWNGSAWTEYPVDGSGTLASVTALAANNVWAVGYTESTYTPIETVVMHWDGTQWTRVTSPNPAPEGINQLLSVSAASANDIWAVGIYSAQPQGGYTQYTALVEHWNGSQWSVVPDSAPADNSRLAGVVALSGSSGWAVGSYDATRTLAEHWDGSRWSEVSSPNPGLTENHLRGVEAISINDAWAVGESLLPQPSSLASHTLIQHWDGTRWDTVPSPNTTSTEHILSAVSAVSASDIWAVGMYGDGGDFWPLTLHWDGTQWTRVPAPNLAERPHYIRDVKAIATDNVWAVGFLFPVGLGEVSETLIMHWDGTQWSYVQSPNLGQLGSQLESLSVVSSSDIWAVGEYMLDNPQGWQPLALHWNGSQWAIVMMPTARPGSMLTGVKAVSANDVWAVGVDAAYPTDARSLTLHWNGTAWSRVPSPNWGANTYLAGVTATSADHVWASGYIDGGAIIERWNGSQWSIVSIVVRGLLDTRLFDISAASPTDIWAVGSYSAGTPSNTHVEHIGRFGDVSPTDYYYLPVECLVSHGAISGYDDCSFRPGNPVTRGQLSKIVATAAGWTLLDPAVATFADVARGSTFYGYVEAMAAHGVVGGYPCGGPGEPCDSRNRPYFRPNNSSTRGQIAKILSISANLTGEPTGQTFEDVPPTNPFYVWIYRLSSRGIVSGYECGGPGEPCGTGNRAYFRPNNLATRGQLAKMAANTFFPECIP